MREQTISGISVSYPDKVVAAFGRCPINISGFNGTEVAMKVKNIKTAAEVMERRAPFGYECFFDLAYYLQVLMKPSFHVDYSNVTDSGMANAFSVELEFLNGTSTIATMDFDIVAVWASVFVRSDESLKMFEGYPFTVGVFTDGTYTINAGGATFSPSVGVHNFPITGNTSVVVKDSSGKVVQSVKVTKSCGEGIYLRWVDKCGIYRYWLFRKGNVTNTIEASDEFTRNNMGTDFGVRKHNKKVKQSIEICAPLVDGNTFNFLLGMAASTVVDMYNNGEWVSVDIDAGDIVQERVMYQDFIVSVLLPETIVQKL